MQVGNTFWIIVGFTWNTEDFRRDYLERSIKVKMPWDFTLM